MNEHKEYSWPGWETVRLIGRGSFGSVYEIQRDVFGDIEKAALKVISIPQNASDIDELYSDGYDDESITSTFQSHLKSIVSEYSLMRKMNGCANVVNCDDIRYVQHDDGIGWDIFIKMELLTPLTKYLPEQIPEKMVEKVAKDICAALAVCKKHEIVHRDIKPQNIFVSDNGVFKLGDFGIAKTVEKTMGGTKIGTYKYMAPEVYNNQPYGTAADIYSLGLVLYWMLNERRMPFMPLPPEKLKAGMEDYARQRRFSGEQLPPPAHGSKKLKAIVMKACAYDPSQRYSSATEILKDLDWKELTALPIPPETPANKFCNKCGNKMELNSAFCTKCGNRIKPDGGASGLYHSAQEMLENLQKISSPQNVVASPIVLPPQPPKPPKRPENISGDKPEVRPYPQTADRPTTDGKKKHGRKTLLWITVAVVLIALLALLLTQCEKAPRQGTWSQWADSLPDYVTVENYVIEARPVYSSRELQTMTSEETNTMDGWELYDTTESGNFGEWTQWTETEVAPSDSREVETQKQYRYRTKETKTSKNKTLDGWEREDTTYKWSDYGNWSSWSSEKAKSSDSRDVEAKKQYRYRTKSYTTSSSSSLSGWTQYKKAYTWSDYGSWSSWSDNPISETDSRDVETKQVLVSDAKTTYTYGAYFSSNSSKPYSWTHFCGTCAKNAYGGKWVYKTYTQSKRATVSTLGQSCGHKGAIKKQYKAANGYLYYFESKKTTDAVYKTQYRYRTREKIYTYHFYKWGDWSKWSDKAISKTDTRVCLSIRNCIKRAPKSTVPGQHRFGFEKPRFCSL